MDSSFSKPSSSLSSSSTMFLLLSEGGLGLDVLERGSEAYERARQRTFAVNAHARPNAFPTLICIPSTVSQVQDCLRYAKQHNYQVTVRSGGHNWFGSSLQQDTLLVDLQHFCHLDIDPTTQTATVGPTVSGQRLNEEAARHGLCFPTGHCPGVPVGGFLLGGGFGWFTDYYGVSAESIRRLEIVTSNGDRIHVSEDANDDVNGDIHPSQDWLWLARGSGAAFPGVVTSFVLQLHPLPPIVRSTTLYLPIDNFSVIVQYLLTQRRLGHLSVKTECNVILCTAPLELRDKMTNDKCCKMSANFLADSEPEFASQLKVIQNIPSTTIYHQFEVQDYSFSELTDLATNSYPSGCHWDANAVLVDVDSITTDDGMDEDICDALDTISVLFENKAPIGLSHILCVVGARHSGNVGKHGACGLLPWPGMYLDCLLVKEESTEKNGAVENSSDDISELGKEVIDLIKPHMSRLNVLEHQCNADTFDQMFPDPTGTKLRTLRTRLDPDSIFWNPHHAKPW